MAAKLTPDAASLSNREKIWQALRDNRNGVTQLRLNGLTLVRGSIIKDYLACLIRGGFVEVTEKNRPGQPRMYRLVRDTGADAPRLSKDGALLPPPGRARMWQAMAVLGNFTPHELGLAASLPESPVAESEAEYYCRWLEKGRYLRRVSAARETPRYQSIPARRHGPKAPQILRVRRLYDPNTGEVAAEEHCGGED